MPDEVYEVERDRHGVMYSGPLEVGECVRVMPVAALDALRSEQGQSRDDTVAEIVQAVRNYEGPINASGHIASTFADFIDARFGAGRAEGEDRDTENEG